MNPTGERIQIERCHIFHKDLILVSQDGHNAAHLWIFRWWFHESNWGANSNRAMSHLPQRSDSCFTKNWEELYGRIFFFTYAAASKNQNQGNNSPLAFVGPVKFPWHELTLFWRSLWDSFLGYLRHNTPQCPQPKNHSTEWSMPLDCTWSHVFVARKPMGK